MFNVRNLRLSHSVEFYCARALSLIGKGRVLSLFWKWCFDIWRRCKWIEVEWQRWDWYWDRWHMRGIRYCFQILIFKSNIISLFFFLCTSIGILEINGGPSRLHKIRSLFKLLDGYAFRGSRTLVAVKKIVCDVGVAPLFSSTTITGKWGWGTFISSRRLCFIRFPCRIADVLIVDDIRLWWNGSEFWNMNEHSTPWASLRMESNNQQNFCLSTSETQRHNSSKCTPKVRLISRMHSHHSRLSWPFTGMALLEGKSVSAAMGEYRQKFWHLFLVSFRLHLSRCKPRRGESLHLVQTFFPKRCYKTR